MDKLSNREKEIVELRSGLTAEGKENTKEVADLLAFHSPIYQD